MNNVKIWHKNIKNERNTPWLDWIRSGIKTYEGRLYKDDWINMNIGDIIIFTDGIRLVKVKILCFRFFEDFESAFDMLGTRLVPIGNCTREQVGIFYSNYFTKQDINKYGVVCVNLIVIN